MATERHLFSVETRALAAVVAFAGLLLMAAVIAELGGFLVKRMIIVGAACAAAVALSACAGMPGITQGATTKDFLDHLEGCHRHYTGTIAATGINGSLDIECPAIVPAGSMIAPNQPVTVPAPAVQAAPTAP